MPLTLEELTVLVGWLYFVTGVGIFLACDGLARARLILLWLPALITKLWTKNHLPVEWML